MVNRWIRILLVALAVGGRVWAAEIVPEIEVDGVKYENVRWGPVNQGKVVMFHSRGATTVAVDKLPEEYARRFGYRPTKPTDNAAEQPAAPLPVPAPVRPVTARPPPEEGIPHNTATNAVVGKGPVTPPTLTQPPKQKVTLPIKTRTLDLGGGVKLELVWIPPGKFMMGSPETEKWRKPDEKQHRVIITKGFWMGKYEVTQRQWKQVMGNNPSQIKTSGLDAPVEMVDWNECVLFCKKIGARLPTEAEWEYACRAGTTTMYYNGDTEEDLARAEWYSGNCDGTRPVGQKEPNAWGLYDMLGNVFEWCADMYGPYPDGEVTDPIGPDLSTRTTTWIDRVERGGRWNNIARHNRCAKRYSTGTLLDSFDGSKTDSIGFRVVVSQ